jgi:hypothetical protein
MRTAVPAYILLMLIGWGTVTQLAIMNVLIQVQVPNGLRGRVFSTYLWAIQGVAPFGSLLIGWWAQTWGVPRTFAGLRGHSPDNSDGHAFFEAGYPQIGGLTQD